MARHQLCLIARVIPHGSTDNKPVYRSLGGYHHSWCYGRLPVQATRRFLDLATQKDNVKIIQYELEGIQGKYAGAAGSHPQMPQTPCSYLMYVAAMAWCFDLDEEGFPYVSGHSFEASLLSSYDSSFCTGPDDGITVIDVTDTFNPAYCHVLTDEPISAEGYVRHYYPKPDDGESLSEQDARTEAHVQQVIASMDGVKLIPIDVLAEVWPHEYSRAQDPSVDTVVAKPVSDEVADNRDNPIPQLSELTINLAVKQSAEEEDFSGLEQLIWMPGKADQIASILRQTDPFPDTALAFFRKALDVNPRPDPIDLSGSFLSSEQVISLLSGFDNLKSLDLSKMPNITIEAIGQILTNTPTIAYLNLLGTSIPNQDIMDLLENEPKLFYHMETLLHSAFLTATKRALYKAVLWFPGSSTVALGGAYPAMPFFTPQKAVDMLWEYLYTLNKAPSNIFFRSMSLLASACMSCGPRPDGQKWGDRSITLIPALFSGFSSTNGGYVLATTDKSYAIYRLPGSEERSNGTAKKSNVLMDVRAFVEFLVVKEGRPAPTGATVDRLVSLIDEMGLALMTMDEVTKYFEMVTGHRIMFMKEYMQRAPV